MRTLFLLCAAAALGPAAALGCADTAESATSSSATTTSSSSSSSSAAATSSSTAANGTTGAGGPGGGAGAGGESATTSSSSSSSTGGAGGAGGASYPTSPDFDGPYAWETCLVGNDLFVDCDHDPDTGPGSSPCEALAPPNGDCGLCEPLLMCPAGMVCNGGFMSFYDPQTQEDHLWWASYCEDAP